MHDRSVAHGTNRRISPNRSVPRLSGYYSVAGFHVPTIICSVGSTG
jgi:hypothetical protein